MNSTLSRRTVLRGLVAGSAATVSLPLFERDLNAHGTALSGGDDLPRRFGMFFWGGGLPWNKLNDPEVDNPDIYTPTTTGADWAMTELLAPLEAHRERFSVVTGYTRRVEIPAGLGDSHIQGQAVVTTGDRTDTEGWDHSDHLHRFRGPTIDQIIARHPDFYGSTTPAYRSLELGVSRYLFHNHSGWMSISWNSPDSPNLAIREPIDLYRRLFGLQGGADQIAHLESQIHVLDAVRADAQALESRLGSNDKHRLTAHLDHISDMEARIRGLLEQADQCTGPQEEPPAIGEGMTPIGADVTNIDRLELLTDMLATALRCDMTRVFTMMFTGGATGLRINEAGVINGAGGEHNHAALHGGNLPVAIAAHMYQFDAFRRFLDRLAAEQDATGQSLLETSCILGTSEYGAGFHHNKEEHPLIFAGGCRGAIRNGLHLRKPNGNLSEAHMSIFSALKLPIASFGGAGAHTSETIPGLMA